MQGPEPTIIHFKVQPFKEPQIKHWPERTPNGSSTSTFSLLVAVLVTARENNAWSSVTI